MKGRGLESGDSAHELGSNRAGGARNHNHFVSNGRPAGIEVDGYGLAGKKVLHRYLAHLAAPGPAGHDFGNAWHETHWHFCGLDEGEDFLEARGESWR